MLEKICENVYLDYHKISSVHLVDDVLEVYTDGDGRANCYDGAHREIVMKWLDARCEFFNKFQPWNNGSYPIQLEQVAPIANPS